ncbi:hypothetical protein WMY93_016688 [Mugilogobius chulae]|uniref:Uncharacterized protein n=1 Tax=Mugilogobius chulae TaxID=88201 RepID=A0AAW0NLH0_9GOBI
MQDKNADRPKQDDIAVFEKENFIIRVEIPKETKQDVPEISTKFQAESPLEIQVHLEQVEDVTVCEDFVEQKETELEEAVAKFSIEEPDVEAARYRDDGDSWDDVLGIVNTLWDEDGWEKRAGAEAKERETRIRFPGRCKDGRCYARPSDSELSLTELERRARELDSDLEHLDLSQPHRENEEVYETRERPDMYQTHPGPQRDKSSALTAGLHGGSMDADVTL